MHDIPFKFAATVATAAISGGAAVITENTLIPLSVFVGATILIVAASWKVATAVKGATDRLERVEERLGRTVQRRQFGCVQFDLEVVDLEPGDGGEAVLAGLDDGVTGAQSRAAWSANHMGDQSRDFDTAQIGTDKAYTVVRLGGLERQRSGLAIEQPGAGERNRLADGLLAWHGSH